MKKGGVDMKLQKKYKILKATTIALGAFTIPWSTFTGFCFGDGRYVTGLVSLFAQTFVALFDGYIWIWVLENMRNRMEDEKKQMAGEPDPEHRIVCPFISGEGTLPVLVQETYRYVGMDTVSAGKAYLNKERHSTP